MFGRNGLQVHVVYAFALPRLSFAQTAVCKNAPGVFFENVREMRVSNQLLGEKVHLSLSLTLSLFFSLSLSLSFSCSCSCVSFLFSYSG